MEKEETDTDTDGGNGHGHGRRTRTTDTDGGHGCNHVRPSATSCNTNMAEASGFVSNVIVSAMEGGKDNPIQISSEDEDVDQR